MVVITLFAQSGLADGALQGLKQGIALLDFTQHTSAFDLSTSTLPLDGTASSRIQRVDLADSRSILFELPVASLVVFLLFGYFNGRGDGCVWPSSYCR